MKKFTVLVVDDDKFSRTFCRQILEEEDNVVVEEAAGVDEALDRVRDGEIDLVVSDMVMPKKSGLDLVKSLSLESPDLKVIVITGHASIENAVEAMKLGALDYIRKPLNPGEFKVVVQHALDRLRLAKENRELKNSLNLYNVSSRIMRTIEIEDLYEVVFEKMLQEVGATRGFLYLIDQEQGDSNIVISEGFDVDRNPDLDRKVFELYGGALSETTVPYCPEVILPLKINYRSRSDPIRSIIFIPLRSKNDLVGMVVFFDTERESAFCGEDLKAARFLCDHAGSAIENAILYSKAKILTITDDLTSAFNYRYLNNILDREMLRAERLGSSMSVLFLDLDSFKKVNDRFGHLVGSKILVELAGLLKEAVRKVDAVARYGGDEYIIVLTDTFPKGAMIVAERIRRMIEEFVFLDEEGYSIRLTISIGVASYPEHAQSKVELLHLADEAMYKGKFGKKNVVYLAVPGLENTGTNISPPPEKKKE